MKTEMKSRNQRKKKKKKKRKKKKIVMKMLPGQYLLM